MWLEHSLAEKWNKTKQPGISTAAGSWLRTPPVLSVFCEDWRLHSSKLAFTKWETTLDYNQQLGQVWVMPSLKAGWLFLWWCNLVWCLGGSSVEMFNCILSWFGSENLLTGSCLKLTASWWGCLGEAVEPLGGCGWQKSIPGDEPFKGSPWFLYFLVYNCEQALPSTVATDWVAPRALSAIMDCNSTTLWVKLKHIVSIK